jgi:hypothetical protein
MYTCCNIEARSRYRFFRGKQYYYMFSVCVRIVALVIRHAKRMCHIILPSVACPALPYFSHYLKKHDFREKNFNKKYVFLFPLYISAETLTNVRRNQRGSNINVDTYVFMYSTGYSHHILMKLEFSQQIKKKYSAIKFHKNPSSGSRVVLCGRTDGRTDRQEKANSRFSQFCERARKLCFRAILYGRWAPVRVHAAQYRHAHLPFPAE